MDTGTIPRVKLWSTAFALTVALSKTLLAADGPAVVGPTPSSFGTSDPTLEKQAAATDADQVWRHRSALIAIDKTLLDHVPMSPDGLLLGANPGTPFTFEEETYDKPRRDWWWNAGRFTVVIVGGLILTYFTGGVLVPYVGGVIGNMAGLSGAAAVSYGLAVLGGGAVATGGFGMAGGTFLIMTLTDLAISTALDYSLQPMRSNPELAALDQAIRYVDANHNEPAAWEALQTQVGRAAADKKIYVLVAHSLGSACMRWAADENLDRAIASKQVNAEQEPVSDRQRILMTAAIRWLEEARNLEPHSSYIHHALGNAYWWLSVREGYESPENIPADFKVPMSSRLQESGQDEVGCFQSALWHYSQGTTSEPRNVHIRVNWANALQADGTLHEAIGVMSGAMPFIGSCRAKDQGEILRTIAMLQYQAFTRSPLWDRVESGGEYPALDESPLLTAAMQGYSRALEIDVNDLSSLTSLAQIHRAAEPQSLDGPVSILSKRDAQLKFVMAILGQEQALADLGRDELPGSYRPGQLVENYKELLRWSFKGLSSGELDQAQIKELYSAVTDWLTFLNERNVRSRPFSRECVFLTHKECDSYNRGAWIGSYDLSVINKELATPQTDDSLTK